MRFNAFTALAGGIVWATVAWMGAAGCGGKSDLDQMVGDGLQQVSERVEGVRGQVQEKAEGLRSDVEQQVNQRFEQAQDAVAQQTGQAGSITLQLEPPLELSRCFADFIRFADDRPSVLQLQSYRSADDETFPSVFLRALTSAKSPADLAGTTLEATIFVQREEGGDVLHSESPVQLEVAQVDDQRIVARILGGSLQRTGGEATVSVTGRLEGTRSH